MDTSLISPTLFKASLLQEIAIDIIDNTKTTFFIMIIVLVVNTAGHIVEDCRQLNNDTSHQSNLYH